MLDISGGVPSPSWSRRGPVCRHAPGRPCGSSRRLSQPKNIFCHTLFSFKLEEGYNQGLFFLPQHVTIHYRKIYDCPVCSKSFVAKSYLKAHMRRLLHAHVSETLISLKLYQTWNCCEVFPVSFQF